MKNIIHYTQNIFIAAIQSAQKQIDLEAADG